jgi:hypothetical protein
LSEFHSDEDQAVGAALAVAAGLSESGQHFAAATVRVLVDYLARSRAEQAAMFGGEPPAVGVAAPPVVDGPKAPGGKRGRPPKVKPLPADASPPAEPSGSSASSTAPPTLPVTVPAEAVAVVGVPVAATAPAAVTA